jgi:hypothetical protein
MIKHFLNILLIVNLTLAQDSIIKNKKITVTKNENNIDLFSNSALIDNGNLITKNDVGSKNVSRIESLEFKFYNEKSTAKNSFDLISSVGGNISFGGVWENYAIVNFTPQLFIKPAGFLSIYANHYINCFIPLEHAKEYSKSILLQSLTVLAVDNSMKYFLNSDNNWIPEVISFIAKNLLLNTILRPAISNSENSPFPILQYENYYYSMSINF